MWRKASCGKRVKIITAAELAFTADIAAGAPDDFNRFCDFQTGDAATEIQVKISADNDVNLTGDLVYAEEGLSWYRDGAYHRVVITSRARGNKHLAILSAADKWQSVEITKIYDASPGVYKTLLEIAFRTAILFHQGIVLHAAAIAYRGQGLVFSAPAGTGKSTHADLWVQHQGAGILNGDRPALRLIDDEVRVYGTPWSGASNQYLNSNAPLSAIFLLEQSPVNEVKELSFPEALPGLLARCYLPYFDQDLMDKALANVEIILGKVPVYRLKCRPDVGAVDKVMAWLRL